MRFVRVFLAILSSILWLGAASAEDALPRDAGIEATIDAQIDAFLKDDFATAFTYASPNIQGFFGTSERFGQMVRNGYPMVWKNSEVRYLELRELGGRLWQMVQVEDEQGQFHYLDYLMIETEEGWQIGAVQFLPEPGVGA